MLSGEDLAFRYSPRSAWVVEGISLQVAAGKVVGLHWPSDRGKTTLARLLARYLAPGRDRVLVDGQALPMRGYCPVQLIFQHPELAVNGRWRIEQVLSEGHIPDPLLLQELSIDPGWLGRWHTS